MKWVYRLLLSFLTLFLPFQAAGQTMVLDTTILLQYNASLHDMTKTQDGGYAITGSIGSFSRILLEKFNKDFEHQWFGIYGKDQGHGNWGYAGINIFQRDNGGFVIPSIFKDGTFRMATAVIANDSGAQKRFIKAPSGIDGVNLFFSEVHRYGENRYLGSMGDSDHDTTYIVEFDSAFRVEHILRLGGIESGKMYRVGNAWIIHNRGFSGEDSNKPLKLVKVRNNQIIWKKQYKKINDIFDIGGITQAGNSGNFVVSITSNYNVDTLNYSPGFAKLFKFGASGEVKQEKTFLKRGISLGAIDVFSLNYGYGLIFYESKAGTYLKLLNKNFTVKDSLFFGDYYDLKHRLKDDNKHIFTSNENSNITIKVIKDLGKNVRPVGQEPAQASGKPYKIAPNPVKETFRIANLPEDKQSFTIRIHNIHGQRVKQMAHRPGSSVYVGSLPQGTYFLEIVNNNKHIETLKMVKL